MLRYRLLGPLAVERDGKPLELGQPKQRALLALLAQEAPRPVSVDRLLDALWGEHPPPSGSVSLHAYVSRLRRILRAGPGAPAPLVRRSGGYLLDIDPTQVDVAAFLRSCAAARDAVVSRSWGDAARHGGDALDLWRGPYLADLADETWVQVAAVPYAEQRQGVLQDLVVALLGLGDLPSALARAATLTAEQPLAERAAWLHTVALYRAGRTKEALGVLDAFRTALVDELGLDVGPDLQDLRTAVLRQDPEVSSWPGPAAGPTPTMTGTPDVPAAAAAPTEAPAPSSTPARVPLVGRAEQLAASEAVLAAARDQASAWLVLSGPPGIGKTRLAHELGERWAATGGAVLRASCPDDSSVPPWWAVRQLLSALDLDADAVLAAPTSADADTAPFPVLERARDALLHVLHERQGAPLLLLVDDAQWADRASLHWLTFLADTADQRGLAVLLTVRSGASSVGLDRLLGAAARRPGRQLLLPPLDPGQVAELVTRISGERLSEGDAAALAARSGGTPLFVAEFARLAPAERRDGVTPEAVRSVLRRRLSALPADLLDVLSTAAALGEPLDVGLLSAVTGRDVDDVGDLLDDAADREVLTADLTGRSYQFAHALLREEAARRLPAVRRRRVHLRAAASLTGATHGQRLLRRATHLRAAGDLADPVELYEAAQALAVAADRDRQPDAAATWWDTTLEAYDRLPEQDTDRRRGLVRARVGALTRAGRGQEILDAVEAGVLDALRGGRTGDAGTLAASLVRVSGAWPWPVYGSDAAPLLGTLRAVTPRLAADPAAQARVLAATAIGHCYDPDPTVPDRLSARAIELAEQAGEVDVLADALLARAVTYAGVALRARESLELLGRVEQLNRRSELDEVLVHNLRTMAHLTLGELGACAREVEAGAAGSDLLRLQLNRVQLRWAEAALAQWHGDLDRARRLYARAEMSHRQTSLQQSGTFELAELILSWEQGRLGEAAGGVPSNPAVAAWTTAVVAASAGTPGGDAALAEQVRRDEPDTWTAHGRLALLAHVVADRGLAELAAPLAARLRPYSGLLASLGQIGIVGPVDLVLARLSDLTGDRPAARMQLRQATELALAAGGAPSVLRCRLLAAQWDNDRAEVAALRTAAAERGLLGLLRDSDQLLDAR